MGTLHLIRGSYHGKVGATIGQKGKGKDIIKSYATPKPDTTEKGLQKKSIFKQIQQYGSENWEQISPFVTKTKKEWSLFNSYTHNMKNCIKEGAFSPEYFNFSGNPPITPYTVNPLWSSTGVRLVIFITKDYNSVNIPLARAFCTASANGVLIPTTVTQYISHLSVTVVVTPVSQTATIKLHLSALFENPISGERFFYPDIIATLN